MKRDAKKPNNSPRRGSKKVSEDKLPSEGESVLGSSQEGELIDLDAQPKDNSSLPLAGVGDVIKRITDFLGFKSCDKCEERRKNFNRKYRFLNPLRDLTDEEIQLVEKVNTVRSATAKESSMLHTTYNSVFGTRLNNCNCSGQLARVVEQLMLWNDESKDSNTTDNQT